MESQTLETVEIAAAVDDNLSNEVLSSRSQDKECVSVMSGNTGEAKADTDRCRSKSSCSCESANVDTQEHVAKLCAKTHAVLRAHQEDLKSSINEWTLRQEQALKVQQASLEKSLKLWATPPKMAYPKSSFSEVLDLKFPGDKDTEQDIPSQPAENRRQSKRSSCPELNVMKPGRSPRGSLEATFSMESTSSIKKTTTLTKMRTSLEQALGLAPKESLVVPDKNLHQWRYSLHGGSCSIAGAGSMKLSHQNSEGSASGAKRENTLHCSEESTPDARLSNRMSELVSPSRRISYAAESLSRKVSYNLGEVATASDGHRPKSSVLLEKRVSTYSCSSAVSGKTKLSRISGRISDECAWEEDQGEGIELKRGYSVVSTQQDKPKPVQKIMSRRSGVSGITDILNMELVPEMESPRQRKRKGRCPRIRKLVKSPIFDMLCGLVVIANAILIGIEADQLMEGSTESYYVTQMCFNGWYVMELGLRLAAEHSDFFSSKDGIWNIFDVVLLVFVLLEVLNLGSTGSSAVMGRFLRSLRVLRVVRTLRIVRVLRYIREFRKMIFAIAASMKTLFWSLLLLSIILYMFGVCLTQGVAEWVHDQRGVIDVDDNVHVQELREFYGSVGLSMYSLYMSITNGLSWGAVAWPLVRVHWSLLAFFVSFISICFFGVLNVVTSVFVESAMHSATHYRELLVQEKMHEKEVYAKHMNEVFKQIDVDDSGEISMEEMEHFLADEHLRAYLEALEIGLVESRMLFKLLDHDDSGWVDIDEFCEGCLRLKGEAKSFDIHCLRYEFHKIMIKWWQFMRYVEARFEGLEGMLAGEMHDNGCHSEASGDGEGNRLANAARFESFKAGPEDSTNPTDSVQMAKCPSLDSLEIRSDAKELEYGQTPTGHVRSNGLVDAPPKFDSEALSPPEPAVKVRPATSGKVDFVPGRDLW